MAQLGRPPKKFACQCDTCGATLIRVASRIKAHNFCNNTCAHVHEPPPILFSEDGLTARIPLRTQRGVVRAYALIDASDAEWAGRYIWRLVSGYAVRSEKIDGHKQSFCLHRELLGLVPGDGLEGDHRNLDKLDNRRENLLLTDRWGNAQNVPSHKGASSQYRGVSWATGRGVWLACVKYQGKTYNLGGFENEIEAAEAARSLRVRLMPLATN